MSTQNTRFVPRKYDKDGVPYWEAITSACENTVRAECLVPPDKVIPIIFIPGIMGSNLKNSNNECVWRPDTPKMKDLYRAAADRQRRLSPSTTQVDHAVREGNKSLLESVSLDLSLAEKRGWGSIFWGSYGAGLQWLEEHLNGIKRIHSKTRVVYTSDQWKLF